MIKRTMLVFDETMIKRTMLVFAANMDSFDQSIQAADKIFRTFARLLGVVKPEPRGIRRWRHRQRKLRTK